MFWYKALIKNGSIIFSMEEFKKATNGFLAEQYYSELKKINIFQKATDLAYRYLQGHGLVLTGTIHSMKRLLLLVLL